jgi:hypothetical protein
MLRASRENEIYRQDAELKGTFLTPKEREKLVEVFLQLQLASNGYTLILTFSLSYQLLHHDHLHGARRVPNRPRQTQRQSPGQDLAFDDSSKLKFMRSYLL